MNRRSANLLRVLRRIERALIGLLVFAMLCPIAAGESRRIVREAEEASRTDTKAPVEEEDAEEDPLSLTVDGPRRLSRVRHPFECARIPPRSGSFCPGCNPSELSETRGEHASRNGFGAPLRC